MVTFFWPKVTKKCQKSQNSRFLISTVWKLLSEVKPYTMKLMRQTVLPDLAKSPQSGKKVLPDVAKSRQRGSKGFQGIVWKALHLGTYAQAPYAFPALGRPAG